MADIPKGYCQCGCGEKTNIATKNQSKSGTVAGQPRKYIYGHRAKISQCNGRKRISHNGKKIRLYKKIVEDILDYQLPNTAVVHHVNGNIQDNNPSNLVVCQNHAYHRMIHAREVALKECGHADWRKCKYCHEYDSIENLYFPPNNEYAMHKRCNAKYHRERRIRISKCLP